jgi:hypothetical protein
MEIYLILRTIQLRDNLLGSPTASRGLCRYGGTLHKSGEYSGTNQDIGKSPQSAVTGFYSILEDYSTMRQPPRTPREHSEDSADMGVHCKKAVSTQIPIGMQVRLQISGAVGFDARD